MFCAKTLSRMAQIFLESFYQKVVRLYASVFCLIDEYLVGILKPIQYFNSW